MDKNPTIEREKPTIEHKNPTIELKNPTIETFTYHTSSKKDSLKNSKSFIMSSRAMQAKDAELIEFVNGYHIAYWGVYYNHEPPMTPFILTGECLTPIHDGDVIEKEWRGNTGGALDFVLRVKNPKNQIKMSPMTQVYAPFNSINYK